MSKMRFAKLAGQLHEAAAGAAWIQWQALGAQAAAARSPKAIVDPEALVLYSLWLRDVEPRAWDFLHGIAQSGPRLLSVQRLKRAMRRFAPDAPRRVAEFAAAVTAAGKDPRWRALAGARRAAPGRPGKVGSPATRLGEPGSLLLRLRTAFGVDARTDALAYLIGRGGAWADVKEISEAILYAKYSVRGACEALAEARMIEARPGRPIRYYAEGRRWTELLGLKGSPPWQPWTEVYALTLRLEEWMQGPGATAGSGSLAASLAREFMLEHGGVLKQLQLDVPDERDHLGAAYLPAFERTVSALVRWLRENA